MRVPFDPPPGLSNNDTIYATPGAIADVTNMRWVDGRAETIGGWATAFATALTGTCRNALAWTDLTGVQNLAFGTNSKLYIYRAGSPLDITPAGYSAGAVSNGSTGIAYGRGLYGRNTYATPPSSYRLRTWSLDSWGQNLVASYRYGSLYQWTNNTSDPAVIISQAPIRITAMLVTPERQVLALGCNEEATGVFNPLCIRGCDIENITVWNTASDNNAFEYILEGGGQIVAATMVGSIVGAWTDNALHQGTFLGNPDQTYQFDVIDTDCGAIGPNCVATLGGVAYWIGKDLRPRAWSYGTKPVVLDCPIWKDFADHVVSAQADKLVAVANSKFGEVWFFYPDSRDGTENSRFIAFKTTSEGLLWFKGDVARTAFIDAGVMSYPVGVTATGTVYNHESGTSADGTSLSWSLKSAGQYLSEAENVIQVQRLRPDFKGQENAISLTAYVRNQPQATPVTKGPYAVAAGAEKVDFRLSGAIVELLFAGTNYARFGKPTFDAVPMGQR